MWERGRAKALGVGSPDRALTLAIIIRCIILPASGSG